MLTQVHTQFAQWGYRSRSVPIQRLDDLYQAIEGQYRQGLLGQELYQGYLDDFDSRPPGSLPGARSIIVAAVPEPQIQVTFQWEGESITATVPPTYGEGKKDRRFRERLRQLLEPAGYQIAQASVPKKLLAVRTGLAEYGKNNITYIPGMGSFYSLAAVYSDLPATDDDWREPQMMESCQNCSACQRHCPSGAITPERFLLHAERCITFHNEKPAGTPFPAWMDPAWHNCLVGCLHCQLVCPENRQVWAWVKEGAEFSQQETAWLLGGVPYNQLPRPTAEKLERLDMEGYVELLPRNLSVLLGNRRQKSWNLAETG